jgi:hypothetical protein
MAKGTGTTASKSSASRTSGNRSSGTKAKPAAADPRRESIDPTGASRRPNGTSTVIDPLLSQPVPLVLPASPQPVDTVSHADVVTLVEPVDEELDSQIDQLLADERSPSEVPMPRDESGRIELPAIVPAELDPELDADTEAAFATDLPTEAVALVERVPRVIVVPSSPLDAPVAALPTEWTDAELTDDMDGTDGLPSMVRPKKPGRRLRAPVVMRRRRRPRVRRVTRVIRQVDTWSVFKVSLVFSLFLYGVVLTAGVLLWKVAQNTGTVDNVQRFFESFGWKSFTLHGGAIFHQAWVAGLFGVVGLTGFSVLVATLFNLITDLVGGIRVTVLEEEVIAREERGLGWRRGSRSAARAEAAAETHDDGFDVDSVVD